MLTEIGSIDNVAGVHRGGEGGQGPAAWASATASTRTTTRGPRSSRRRPTRCSRSPARTRCSTSRSKLEEVALSDDYFISRKLYPNVDFYSGLIYQAMGFPIEMFTVLFAIPRTVGLAGALGGAARRQDQKIARPRQLYIGAAVRDYVLDVRYRRRRNAPPVRSTDCRASEQEPPEAKRRRRGDRRRAGSCRRSRSTPCSGARRRPRRVENRRSITGFSRP